MVTPPRSLQLKLPLNVNCVNPLVITKDPSTLHSVPLFCDSDPVFLPALDPDPVFKLWINNFLLKIFIK